MSTHLTDHAVSGQVMQFTILCATLRVIMETANAGIPTHIEIPRTRIDALWWAWLILSEDNSEPGARAYVTDWLIAAGQVP